MKQILRIVLIMFLMIQFNTINVYGAEVVDTSNHAYTYYEMSEDITVLTSMYPDKLSVHSIGTSCDGRSIYELVLGNPAATKSVYVQAGLHGREWMNCMLVMKQVEYSLTNFPDGFSNCNIHIVPMVNPDGVTISQMGLAGLNNESLRVMASVMPGAKNPSKWKANARGVDINRNFTTGWGSLIDSTGPSSENYLGTAPTSEPETLAIINSFNATSYLAAVSYHSFEGAIYWDLGQTGNIRTATANLALIAQSTTGYRFGSISPLKGLEYNMMIFEKGVPAIVIETGSVPCPMPHSQWKPLWSRNKNMLVNLASTYSL